MKVCCGCQTNKSLDEFHRKKKSADGYQPKCKVCAKRIALDHYHKNKGNGHSVSVRGKTCTHCSIYKKSSEFFVRKASLDSLQPCCKECDKILRASRYYENWNKERETRKEYNRKPERVVADAASKRQWAKRNPTKRSAHNALNNAIRDGTIKRPKKCSQCSLATRDLEAHHHDYSKPFEIEWLCTKCHGKRH